MAEDSSMEQKTWQVYSFGKISVFRLHLNESGEGFHQRRRGRPFHVDGLKTLKNVINYLAGRQREIEKIIRHKNND